MLARSVPAVRRRQLPAVAAGHALPAVRAGPRVVRAGQLSCQICDRGHFAPTNGSTQCQQCPPGFISDHPEAASCAACPVGTFTLGAGSAFCQGCSEGRFARNGTQSESRRCTKRCALVVTLPLGACVFQPATRARPASTRACPAQRRATSAHWASTRARKAARHAPLATAAASPRATRQLVRFHPHIFGDILVRAPPVLVMTVLVGGRRLLAVSAGLHQRFAGRLVVLVVRAGLLQHRIG